MSRMYLESPTPRNLQHRRPPFLSQAWLETFWGLKSNRGLGLGSQEQPWLGLGSQEQPWPENFWGLKSHRGRIVNGVSAAVAASVRRARCGFSEEGGPQEADDSQESGSKLAAFESSQKNSSNRIRQPGPRIFVTSKVIKHWAPYSVKTHPPNWNNDIEVAGFLEHPK